MDLQFTIKITCLLFLITIIVQDFRERAVYIWLFIGTSLFMACLYFFKANTPDYFVNIGVNLSIIFVIIGILFLYANFKLKMRLNEAFGLGDVFFFVSIAVSFPIATFLVLFSFSLLFSLVIFQFLKASLKEKTVPLAGLQALFFFLIFSINWMFRFTNLYAL